MSASPEPTTEGLSKLLDPVTDCFTPDVAKRVAELQADADVQARIDDLADRANEGLLSEDEAAEYDAYIQAMDVIAVLQARARMLLSNDHS